MADVTFRSSGTTGTPKEIVRTDASLAADAEALVAAFPELWAGRPLVVSSARPEHMLGHLWCRRAPQLAGCAVRAETVLSVEELAEACDDGRATGGVLFVTTPSFLEKALKHPDFAALKGRIAGIVASGGALRPATAQAVQAVLGACPLEIYGSTEAGTVAWRRSSDDALFTLQRGVTATRDATTGALVIDSPYATIRPLALSDAAEFVSPRRFRLLGRLDRQVKILETFVSLPDVEAAFAHHPLVADVRVEAFGDDVPRLGALVVLTDEGRAALAAGTFAAFAAALRRDLRATLGERALPRRIRVVRELPTDARGKTTAADVRAALSAWCREPVVADWSATAERLEATLVFPPDCECFRGHFPGFPILPGVAQLYFLRHFARQAFPDFPDAATYRKLKFQRLVRPSEPVALRVTREGEGRFAFSLDVASERAASGVVERERGTGNGERGTGNGECGTGNGR